VASDDPISATEAAKVLGVSASTVTRRAQLGDIPAKKVGRQWMIKPSDLPKIKAVLRRRLA